MRDFGIILAAHGNLAAALQGSMELLVGEQPGVKTVALQPGMGREEILGALRNALEALPEYPKKLILTDLVGGTPCNMALQLVAEDAGVQLIGGVNMPLLCEAALADTLNTAAMAELVEVGRDGLSDEGARLRQTPRKQDESTDTDL